MSKVFNRHYHWTKKRPEKAGLYWLKYQYGSPLICQLEFFNRRLCANFIGTSKKYTVDEEIRNALWSGPIPMPKDE